MKKFDRVLKNGSVVLIVLCVLSLISALFLSGCGGDSENSSPPVTYNITGKVALNGTGLADVTVTLTGSASVTATTDSNGNYLFAGVQNGSHTITPSKAGYTFTPVDITASVNNADVTGQDFIATAVSAATYNITGKVNLNGTGLAGVTVTLTGGGSGTTTTDANGNYLFTGTQSGAYTITPSMTGHIFTPASQSITVSNADVSGQDFAGSNTGSISVVW